MQLRALAWGALALAPLAAGCRTVPVQEPLMMTIRNASESQIHSVVHKPCGSPDSDLVEIPIEEIEPGQAVRVYLPDECIDLMVFDEQGRVAGVQRDLRMLPHATWTIR